MDYDDVFGGPPRFVGLLSGSQAGSAALDNLASARAPSFRSSSLPVFELPVFGDHVLIRNDASILYNPRAMSDSYDGIFDGSPMREPFSASKHYGISMSKPSSRSSSRRMSPVHPFGVSVGQPRQDETKSSGSFQKTRSALGRFSMQGSVSSTSSFDEYGGKNFDGSLRDVRSDSFTSSLPSSPPQPVYGSEVKISSQSSNSIELGLPPPSMGGDGVFGSYSKRTFSSQSFSSVQLDCKSTATVTECCSVMVPKQLGIKSLPSRSRASSISSTAHSKNAEITQRSLPSSSSFEDGQRQHDDVIDVRMERSNDSLGMENLELLAGSAYSGPLDGAIESQHRASPQLPLATPPLKFKSWKDWATELTVSHISTSTSSSSLTNESVMDVAPSAMMSSAASSSKEHAEVAGTIKRRGDKNSSMNLSGPNHVRKSSQAPKVKVKSVEYTVEMEERELQALLANARKNHNKAKGENTDAKFPKEMPKAMEAARAQDEEQMTQSTTREPKLGHAHQNVQVDSNVNVHWKEWRKYASKESKELATDVCLKENHPGNISNRESVTPALDMSRHCGVKSVLSMGAQIKDIQEVPKAGTQDVSTSSSMASTKAVPQELKSQASRAALGKSRNSDIERIASFCHSASGLSQDYFEHEERHETPCDEAMEESVCSSDFVSSSNGFQEIEGESFEHKKSRWERHMRVKEHAAKALEEMQNRDAELQWQQAQKQQSAETADGQVKRWAGGKEGNLRALLSNLQHVLWSDSGWQPIPLTELIEVPDVKKAYRKATLFVHPDKMQQKGATIQQKYIAERVFDILQEAWKTFNMQELF